MNTDDELERRIRTHYRAIDPGPAPPDLVTRIADVIGGRPRRRALAAWLRPAVALGVAISVAALALGPRLGGLLSMVSASHPPAVSAAPSSPQTRSPAPSGTPPASAAPSATPGAPTIPSAAADQAGTFRGGLWATRGSTLSISTDAGASWQRSTIPTAAVYLGTGVFVLDRAHAWSITPGPGSTPFDGSSSDVLHLVVHRTADGGRTWQQATVPGNYAGTGEQLVFVDAQHGYLMCSAIRGSTGLSTVLRTDDGGRTWSVAGTGNWLGSRFNVSDSTTLWAGAEQEAGPVVHPLLDVSRDGGRTWVPAVLPGVVGPSAQGMGGAMRYLVEPPLFLDALTGTVAIVSAGANGTLTTFYRTSDGGRTWSKVGDLRLAAAAGPALLDARAWLLPVQNPTGLEATADGGVTWHALAPSGLPANSWIDWIAGVDGTHAAALVSGPWYPAPDELFLSSDAGRSWRPAVLGGTPGSAPSP